VSLDAPVVAANTVRTLRWLEQISVAKLLLRKEQNLFLDHSLHSSLMKHLPPGSAFLPKPDDDETRERSIRLCQEKHVILITADLGSAPALDSDAGGA
jgi:hypothetical protein